VNPPSELDLRRTQRRVFRGFRLFASCDTDMPPCPINEPTILTANHRSLADLFLAASLFHIWKWPVRPLVAGSYFEKPVIGLLLKRLGAIPVTGSDAIDVAKEVLSSGISVAVMPEGRVVRPEEWEPTGVGTPRIGVARLAIETKCPVLLIGVAGTEALWPRGRFLPKFTPWKRTKTFVRLKSHGTVGGSDPESVLTEIWSGVKEMVEKAEADRHAAMN